MAREDQPVIRTIMRTSDVFIYVWLAFLGWALLMYWIPVLAVDFYRRSKKRPVFDPASAPFLLIVSSCLDGAAMIPGLVECLLKQDYPHDKFKLLILADNCTDNSAALARSLGVEVIERHDREKMGKGYALNNLLDQQLRHRPFDGLVLFDIDARVGQFF